MNNADVLTRKDRRLLFLLLGLCGVIMSGLYLYAHTLTPVMADCRSDTPVSPGKSCFDRATGTVKSDQVWNEQLRARQVKDGRSGDQ